jgi:hypothetical protein
VIGRIIGAAIVAFLALVAWLGIGEALHFLNVWEKSGLNADRVIFFGGWVVAIAGFTAPLVLTYIFRKLYPPPEEQQPQKPRRVAPQNVGPEVPQKVGPGVPQKAVPEKKA